MSTISKAQEVVFRELYDYILSDTNLGPREKAIKIAEHLYGAEGSEDLQVVVGRGTLARMTGVTSSAAISILQNAKAGILTVCEPGLKGAINAEDFIERNDVTLQMRNGLDKLEGSLIPDMQFRDALGITPQIWSQVRERDEFKKYQLTVRKILYWAQPSVIDKVRASLDYL